MPTSSDLANTAIIAAEAYADPEAIDMLARIAEATATDEVGREVAAELRRRAVYVREHPAAGEG